MEAGSTGNSNTAYTGKRKCCDKAEYEVYHEFFKRNLFIVADGKDLQHNSC